MSIQIYHRSYCLKEHPICKECRYMTEQWYLLFGPQRPLSQGALQDHRIEIHNEPKCNTEARG